jgi:AbrB family looped-hinge helix DNA binding protein
MSNLHFDVKEDQNMYERVGVIKEIDKLGRIVIPKEFRQRLELDKEVEILVTKDGILLKKPGIRSCQGGKKQ